MEPLFIQFMKSGGDEFDVLPEYSVEALFGEMPPIQRNIGGLLKEDKTPVNAIVLSRIAFRKSGENTYDMEGKICLPKVWDEYEEYLKDGQYFVGMVSYTQEGGETRLAFKLEAPLYQSFVFPRAEFQDGETRLVSYGTMKDNQLYLRLVSHVKQKGVKNRGRELGKAALECRMTIDQLGQISMEYSLFRGNEWSYAVSFSPYLSLGSMAAFIQALTGIPDVSAFVRLPEGIPGLDFLKLRSLRFSLTPKMVLHGIEIVLSSGEKWAPGIPFFTVVDMGVSFYFRIPVKPSDGGVEVSCGLSGDFLISLTEQMKLKLGVWCDLPGLDLMGELLVQDNGQKQEPSLAELLAEYNVPAKNVEGVTVAGISFLASPGSRCLRIDVEVKTKDVLRFQILGLRIEITSISGSFTYAPDALSLNLMGEIKVGKNAPFTLMLCFDYDCEKESGWHFQAALTSGEVSIARLFSELFLIENTREEAVFDLKLTELDLEFYSNERPFTIRASLEQPWQRELLGVSFALFGSVDLKKQPDESVEGTLMMGVKLNAFQIKVIYELAREANLRFQIWYENAYLDAAYRKEQGRELLTLSLRGMTVGSLIEGFVHMVNPNADYKLAAPWDVLNRIYLDAFSLEFDMKDRTVSLLYNIELDIAGLVSIRQIGVRYSNQDGGGVQFLLVGSFLEKEYSLTDPLSWDVINDGPPQPGGADSKLLRLSYLGMGQHFGTEELLSAGGIEEALAALRNVIEPVAPGQRPAASYSEDVNWLFGADMTYKGMLRVQMVLNDPSLYGVLITVQEGNDDGLSQFAGLSLELLYKRVTEEIGMFSAELTAPDKFKTFQFGAFQVTLGRFYIELYTNGNFLLDLGFPHRQDFSTSFAIEAGYYTGRGGFYFGVLNGDTASGLPRISSGTFSTVLSLGVGISLGVGRSFDFSIVKGGASLELFAIFEGLFAIYTPLDTKGKKDVYYKVTAVAGIFGRLFLTVDFKIITISATAEIKAYATVILESCKPMYLSLDLELKVGAKIKILFIKISFSFHFSMHMDLTIGKAEKPPWTLAGSSRMQLRHPDVFHSRLGELLGGSFRQLQKLELKGSEKVEIPLRILPLYSVEQPSLTPCAAFLLLVEKGENGFDKIIALAEEWLAGQLGERAALWDLKQLSQILKQEKGDFVSYFMERTTLVFVQAELDSEQELDGVFFPACPGLLFDWQTLDEEGTVIAEETVDFAGQPVVSGDYVEQLRTYFQRLNPSPQEEVQERGTDEAQALARVLLEDYFSIILQALLKEAEDGLRLTRVKPNGRSLREIAEEQEFVVVPWRKRAGETLNTIACELGLDGAELIHGNRALLQSVDKEKPGLAHIENGHRIDLAVGVTPSSILLDNPEWKFTADTLTIGENLFDVRGMSVEEVRRTLGISLEDLAEAAEAEQGVFEEQTIVLRNVPAFAGDSLRRILRSESAADQASGMVSRFFLQGLRLPVPGQEQRWDGLYRILGQQKTLLPIAGAEEDFVRHCLKVRVAEGYASWISLAPGYSISMTNHAIQENAPTVPLKHVYRSLPGEIEPYRLSRRQHPFLEYRLYKGADKRQSLLLFTADFLLCAEGHLADYEWAAAPARQTFYKSAAGGQLRQGDFATLLALRIKKLDRGEGLFQVSAADKKQGQLLYAIKDTAALFMVCLCEPSPAQGMEAGLYPLSLDALHTRLIKTNLSKESRNIRLTGDEPQEHCVASFSDTRLFLNLLWQQSVTSGEGYYLHLRGEEELSASLFSESGEAAIWLLVTQKNAVPGCNCILSEDEIPDSQLAWLQIKEDKAEAYPSEYAVKSILDPGNAGFTLVLEQPPEDSGKKEDFVRNLYSIVNYRVSGEGYETLDGGIPLLPADDGQENQIWEYAQSVPLYRFWIDEPENRYANTGAPAEIALEYRDVLGNADAGGLVKLTITPRYNDPLLGLHQTGAVTLCYLVKDRTLQVLAEPSLEACSEQKQRTGTQEVLKKSLAQMDAGDLELWLESSLIHNPVKMELGKVKNVLKAAEEWLCWMDGLAPAVNGSASFAAAAEEYALTPEELAAANLTTDLSVLFGIREVNLPHRILFRKGDRLSDLGPCKGAENGEAMLRGGAEVIAREEAYTTRTDAETFSSAALRLGCAVSSLVSANQGQPGILTEHYVFSFQGYEVEVGAEEEATASLLDVCDTFREQFNVEVSPQELAAEEEPGILKAGVTLVCSRFTAREGETLASNHFGCPAEELWEKNRQTADLLEDGTPVWCGTAKQKIEEGETLSAFCQVYGISPRQFYRANQSVQFEQRHSLHLPGRLQYPEAPFTKSFTLADNEGAGYCLAAIVKQYSCGTGFWFYRQLEDLLIEGREIPAGTGSVAIRKKDTLESVYRRLSMFVEDAESLLYNAVIIRDKITLPLLPGGHTYETAVDAEGIRNSSQVLRSLYARLSLRRTNGTEEERKSAEIFRADTEIPPFLKNGSIDAFSRSLEACLPFAYVARGGEDAGTGNGLCLFVAKGSGGLQKLRIGPAAHYGENCLTPAFYALAPISTTLITRSGVRIAPLLPGGTLGEPQPHTFSGIDPEQWAAVFFSDVEGLFSAGPAAKACDAGCADLLDALLAQKEILTQAVPQRLCHVLKPAAAPDEDGLAAAREVFTDYLRKSLSQAYGKNVLLQYEGNIETAQELKPPVALSSKLWLSGERPLEFETAKLRLTKGRAFFNLFVKAGRLYNASFALDGLSCRVDEVERLETDNWGDYAQSTWYTLQRPITKESERGNLEIDLSSQLPAPVPLRFYPGQPVLNSQAIKSRPYTTDGSFKELLCFDYEIAFCHEMASQDSIYIEMIFNERPQVNLKNTEKDLFDCLAQYSSVREELLELLSDEAVFKTAYETLLSLIQDTAAHWNCQSTRTAAALAKTAYSCNIRTRFEATTFYIDLRTEDGRLPKIEFLSKDGVCRLMECERKEKGGLYSLFGLSQEALSGGIALHLTLEELNIFEYQSAYTKMHVSRNEDLTGRLHAVNEQFLYRTEEVAFAEHLNVLLQYDEEVELEIPEDYKPGGGFFERAVSYLFGEVLGLDRQNTLLTCQISYGYSIGTERRKPQIALPVFFRTKSVYSGAWQTEVIKGLQDWYKEFGPPDRGRFLAVDMRIYSTELSQESLPVFGCSRLIVK